MLSPIIPKGIDPAFHADMTDATYRSATGLSQSSIKEFLISPAHYLASTEQVREATKAMNFGSAFHAHLLSADPEAMYAVKEKVDGRSKLGKEYNDNFAIQNQGKIIIDQDDLELITAMGASVMAHPEANRLMTGLTHKEVALFGTFKAQTDEVRLKGLVDGYNESTGEIIDLKTCEDASPAGFRKAIWDRRYDIQNAQYAFLMENAGKPFTSFTFICVEKKPPFACAVYQISPDSLLKTCGTWVDAIERFAQCQATGIYPAYSKNIIEITL